ARSLEFLKVSLSKEISAKETELATLRTALTERSKVLEAQRVFPSIEKEVSDVYAEGKQALAEAQAQVTAIEDEIKVLSAELAAIVIDETLTQKKTEWANTLKSLKASLAEHSQALEAERTLPELEKEVADLYAEGKRAIAEGLLQVTVIEGEIRVLNAELAAIVIDETLAQKKTECANTLESLWGNLTQA